MANKYIIRRKHNGKYFYYSGTGLDEFDMRINEAIVYDQEYDANIDAYNFKKRFDDVQVIAVKVNITPVRARSDEDGI